MKPQLLVVILASPKPDSRSLWLPPSLEESPPNEGIMFPFSTNLEEQLGDEVMSKPRLESEAHPGGEGFVFPLPSPPSNAEGI